MRVAYLSPLPPQRSGIADYSAELLPALAEHLEIELVVADGARLDPGLGRRFPVRRRRELPELMRAGRYATLLHQIGNHADYHGWIYRALQEFPGVTVLHEYVLHHMLRELTLAAGDREGYVEELRYAYGATGEALGRRCLATGVPVDPWRYPLCERVVDRSRAVIVHNEACRRRVLESRPLARVARVPHHLSLGPAAAPPERAAARAALGLPADAFVVASFGFVTPVKLPGVLLRGFARFRARRPRARLLLVGEVSTHFDWQGLFAPELRAGVEITGRLDLERFLLHMAAADVAVNLRHPSAGETSGTLIRLLGMGTPLVVSDAGSFAELPDDCVAKLPRDEVEEELLAAYLERLADDEPLRRRLGENARRHAEAHHSLAASARAYAAVVRGVVEEGAAAFVARPPLLRADPADVLAELLAEAGTALVDLGVDERQDDLLAGVAETVVDLDCDLLTPARERG